MAEHAEQTLSLEQYSSPRYWPTWLGIFCMRLMAKLPFAMQIKLGQFIGWLSYHLARGRRHVCETNIRLCFPELSEQEQQQLVKRTFLSNGIGFVEICIAWCGNPDKYRDLVTIYGKDKLDKALSRNKGVLLVGSHLTTFEI